MTDRVGVPGAECTVNRENAEQEFLEASVAVWREVDRLEAEGPYPGIPPETDLRQRERVAWERYRRCLDGEKVVVETADWTCEISAETWPSWLTFARAVVAKAREMDDA